MSAPMFWCVWCVGGGSPTYQHYDFAIAKAEAQRLARDNPGKTFAVLAAALAYTKRDLDEVQYLSTLEAMDDEVPF